MQSKLSLIRVKKLTSWLEFNNRYKISFIFANWQILHYIHVNNVGFFWKKITFYSSENRASSQNKMRNVRQKYKLNMNNFLLWMISKSNTVFDSFFIELNNITLENCHPFEIVLTVSSLTRLWHDSPARRELRTCACQK